ncbi:MAG TPA: pyruvate dehydrogenase complex E1 component subunit beta [Thermoanaerobaculia bacterium]|nr:pyruvate dehydrogenase complex E1 component subunit beta [Thermoanaerobaculia bacterium]
MTSWPSMGRGPLRRARQSEDVVRCSLSVVRARAGRRTNNEQRTTPETDGRPTMSEKSYRDAIREAMMEEMDRDEKVLIMGEDIGVYEGTFRITAGMLKKYGPRRVIDTPIAEAGMVGTAVGMAMVGLRPIVEMMTVNFAIVAADQILNHAAKVRYFSGGQVDVPMVIRGPQGAGVQLSAQHSQSFESFYAHFPGLHVVAPATPADAKGLLKTAIRGRDPVMFLESAALYGMKGEVPDDRDFTVPFGQSRVAREGSDVTIVSFSRMLQLSLVVADKLAADEGIECEVIDLRTLRPLDLDPVYESVAKTHRAVVVQEQWKPFGAGAEIAASITEQMFDDLDAPVARVTGEDVPMPYARNLELLATPHEEHIARAVKKVMYRS